MKIVATIEARMTSTRLPGKVLLPVMGKPMLSYLISRLQMVPSIDEIVLATTTNVADESLVDFANMAGIRYYRGSEENVLSRVIAAAEMAQADVIVEITGDCPLIDPDIVEQTIRMFKAHHAVYVSNDGIPTYPMGMNVQVYTLAILKKSAQMTNDPLDQEHVTRHIRHHPEIFPSVCLVAPPSLHWPELGLTLDELADYQLLKLIMEHFGNKNRLFSCFDIIRLLREKPHWVEINSAVGREWCYV